MRGKPFQPGNTHGGKREGAGRKPRDIVALAEALYPEGDVRNAVKFIRDVAQGKHDDLEPEVVKVRLTAAIHVDKRVFGNYRQPVDADVGGDISIRVMYEDPVKD